MSAATPDLIAGVLQPETPPAGSAQGALRAFCANRTALVAAIVLLLIVALSVLAPIIAPYGSNQSFDIGTYAPVSGSHLLGTDGQARDVLTRVIWGGRVSLPAAVLPAVIATPIGLLVGMLAAQTRGILEEVLMRVVDVGLSFPIVVLAIALAGVEGGGFWTVVLAIGCALAPYVARVSYNVTQTLRSKDFVIAGQATGERRWQVVRWELLPNVLPSVIVYVTSLLGTIMVVASGLSFFGLGVAPPTADWGQMVNAGRVALSTAPLASLAPGALIVITALCFAFIGDGLRDVLDPRG